MPKKATRKRHSPEVRAAVLKAHREKTPIREISERFHVHPSLIYSWASSAGVTKRQKGETTSPSETPKPNLNGGAEAAAILAEMRQDAEQLIRSGSSLADIPERYLRAELALRRLQASAH